VRPIISLILPAYNVSDYIDACLDSCLNQDISKDDYEIIVVNDGSTDDTPNHILAYSSRYANIRILNQSNQGLSMARNNGVKLATGKYIWFIDSDDVITSNCLGNLIRQMEERNLEMLVVAPSIPAINEFPASFNPINELTPVLKGSEYMLNSKSYGSVVGAWCFIILRSFWTDNRFQFYKGIAYEDTQLMPLLMSKCQRLSVLTKFSCYHYIQRGGSIMNSAPDKRKLMSHAIIVNTHIEFAKEAIDVRLRNLFLNSARNAYFAGLNALIAMKADKSLQNEFFSSIQETPKIVSADTFLKRVFQYIVLNFPRLYVKLRCH
jgi:glycosyltransferase involved in cell wall biosynthesis